MPRTARWLEDEFGIDGVHNKLSAVTRRSEPRLAVSRVVDSDECVKRLRANRDELDVLQRDRGPCRPRLRGVGAVVMPLGRPQAAFRGPMLCARRARAICVQHRRTRAGNLPQAVASYRDGRRRHERDARFTANRPAWMLRAARECFLNPRDGRAGANHGEWPHE
jgi:hypothetical protein